MPPLDTHAVIEYGNRLLTGFVGFAVIAASVLALFRRPFRWHLALFGALLPLGVIGQAILGALVVKYHLAPGLVMSHFILSMLLLDAAFALAWCSRYEPGERRRSSDRLGVWAVRALIPLGQLTILAGTIATASGPHAGAHAGQLVHRFDFEGTGTLEWVVQRHAVIATVFGLAAIAVWLLLRRPGGDRRAAEAPDRGARPARPAGRRRRRPVGPEAARRRSSGSTSPSPPRPGWRCSGRSPPPGGWSRARGRGRRRATRRGSRAAAPAPELLRSASSERRRSSASRSTTTWVIGRSISLAGALDDAALEPARALRRVGRDHDLVGREDAQRVLDRDVGIGVADLAPRLQPERARCSISESSIRWRASSIASSMSEAQCAARDAASAGVTTRISLSRPRQRLADLLQQRLTRRRSRWRRPAAGACRRRRG